MIMYANYIIFLVNLSLSAQCPKDGTLKIKFKVKQDRDLENINIVCFSCFLAIIVKS